MEDYLLIANGQKSGIEKTLAKGREVIALDGAANLCKIIGLCPNVVLGDFDSIEDLQEWHSKGVSVVHCPDQNETDLAKGIAYCSSNARSIWIVNGTGKRLDHHMVNVGYLRRYHMPKRELLLFTATEVIRFIKDETFHSQLPLGPLCDIGFPRKHASPQKGCAMSSKTKGYRLAAISR